MALVNDFNTFELIWSHFSGGFPGASSHKANETRSGHQCQGSLVPVGAALTDQVDIVYVMSWRDI
jgi:hypothetical protein